MQKKILTAAVAAALVAPAAVMAQSTVVLYGLVDVGYQNVSRYNAPGTADGSKSFIATNGARSSRLGARVTEDLGSGLSARAVIEFDIQSDSGTTPTLMTGRQTLVSLDSKSWGELSLGRQYTHLFNTTCLAEGHTCFNTFQSWGSMEDMIVRSSNYVKYSSPVMGGGFTFGAGWAPGEATTSATRKNGNLFDFALRYEAGPFGIGFAQARVKTQSAVADFTEKDTNIAGYYKFGDFKIAGVHARSSQSGTGAFEQFRMNGIRGEMNIGKGILAVSLAKRKDKLRADADSSFLGIGYWHNMTVRTQFYATYARMNNKSGTTSGATGTALLLTNQGPQFLPTSGADPRGFQIGMGHSF